MTKSIQRLTHRTSYIARDFTLTIFKKSEKNLLTFTINKQEMATVYVDRKESSYVLKKFKKHIDFRPSQG